MRLEFQVLIAFGVDLLLGDPRWLPHPVKLIGRFAAALEAPLRRAIRNERAAGIVAVALVLGVTAAVTTALLLGAARWHPVAGDVVAIGLLYTCFATRDLAAHSYQVYRALQSGDLPEARRRVAMLVGRDTDRLDETGVARAVVESVAENLVDGVTAPIVFAVLGGPVGALLYKATSTLDSTFGYKTDRYLQFGWASARLDDVLNWLPARLTAPLVALTALAWGLSPTGSWRAFRRDARNHESPNAGWPEAAVAGALGVQLGGVNFYGGEAHDGPRFGNPSRPLERRDIVRTNRLMLATSVFCLLLLTGGRAVFFKLWFVWKGSAA